MTKFGVKEERLMIAKELQDALDEGKKPILKRTLGQKGSYEEFEVTRVLQNGDVVCRFVGRVLS